MSYQIYLLSRRLTLRSGGSYRRGKLLSGDMDLLITYPHQEGREKGILQRLLYRLQAKGGSASAADLAPS